METILEARGQNCSDLICNWQLVTLFQIGPQLHDILEALVWNNLFEPFEQGGVRFYVQDVALVPHRPRSLLGDILGRLLNGRPLTATGITIIIRLIPVRILLLVLLHGQGC